MMETFKFKFRTFIKRALFLKLQVGFVWSNFQDEGRKEPCFHSSLPIIVKVIACAHNCKTFEDCYVDIAHNRPFSSLQASMFTDENTWNAGKVCSTEALWLVSVFLILIFTKVTNHFLFDNKWSSIKVQNLFLKLQTKRCYRPPSDDMRVGCYAIWNTKSETLVQDCWVQQAVSSFYRHKNVLHRNYEFNDQSSSNKCSFIGCTEWNKRVKSPVFHFKKEELAGYPISKLYRSKH